MKALKQFGFKLIVILCIIMTFGCFVASTPISYASKVKSGDSEQFYYSGTTKGSYTVDKGFWARLVEALSAILDYLLGIFTMAFRIVFVGLGELLERALTWMIEGASGIEINIDSIDPTGMNDSNDYITVESIVFNHVPFFNINVFNYEVDEDHDSLGRDLTHDKNGNEIPVEKRKKSDISENSLINVLKQTIAGWYYSFRFLALMVMLVLLIYLGIKLAVASVATEKALYKRVLTDWVVGLILVFFMHYIILAMITFNEILVDEISKIKIGYGSMEVYEYGLKERAQNGVTDSDMEISIYDEVRTRAYDARLSVGTTGMVMYLYLIYYAWKFSFLYLKRYLVIAVLIIMSPIIAVMYAYNKIKTGKASVFSNWFKELFFMIMLQSIHALMYVVFLEQALAISLSSIGGIIFAFVMLNFMTKAEEIFRKIFNVQGNLTSDLAGSKLSDIKKLATNLTMGAVGAKAAVATTKFTARALTKPARLAGGVAFGNLMVRRANKLDKKKENDNPNEMTDEEKDDINYAYKLKLGAVAKSIRSNKYEDLSDQEKKALKKLREVIPMSDENGKSLSEEEYMQNFMKKKTQFASEYDILDKKKYRTYISAKWKEITDPYQYVEKNDKGKYKRKKNVREHEDWGPIARVFSKKKDGATATLFDKYMNSDYLFGFNSDEKKFLKERLSLIKSSLIGFTGILAGMPLAIAEPKIGFPLLAKGISDAHKTKIGIRGAITENKNIRGYDVDFQGKWYFTGYQGKSTSTMANGALSMAREQAQYIENTKAEHDKQVVKRAKKHKKLMDRIKGNAATIGIGTAAVTTASLAAINTINLNPISAGVISLAAGSVYSGNIIKRAGKSSSYMNFLQVVREHEAKNLDDHIASSLDGLLDFYAGKYYETETEKYDLEVAQKEAMFASVYESIAKKEIERVEKLSDAELLRDSNYEEPIEVRFDNGVKHLTSDAEHKLISKAIIENAEKSGIINLEEYDIKDQSKIKQVKVIVKDMLVQRGIVDKQTDIDTVIDNLDSKIKAEKEHLQKSNSQAVESKMLDDSIIEVMQEKGITNPNRVSEKDVAERFEAKYRKMAETPSEQSNEVIANMQKKEGGIEGQTKVEVKLQEILERVKNGAITARKSSFSEKSRQQMSDKARQEMKDALAKKNIKALNDKMISHEDSLGEDTKLEQTTEDETQADTSSKTDEVLRMLDLQTKIHKDRNKLVEASNYSRNSGKARILAYKSKIIDSDGTIRANSLIDGSRTVTASSRTMEVPKESKEALIEIINRVNSQINI